MNDPGTSVGYEHPQAKWVCGNLECGSPCAIGPTVHGSCPEAHPCAPRREGDRWKCTRSKLQGGPCDGGPHPDGVCGLPAQRCAPQASLRTSRGGFVFATAAALLGAFAVSLASPKRNEVLVPGGLTPPHAQILREQGTDRCASCHEQGRGSLASWTLAAAHNLTSVLNSTPRTGPTQSTLCLECHKKTINPTLAHSPHTTSAEALAVITTGHGALPQTYSALSCSACHQEHHGAQHDLTRMTTSQCNHCHHKQFDGFVTGHPEFQDWPYDRRTKIAFTHAAHEFRHFPSQNVSFSCNDCHQTRSGEIVATVGYEVACASCHDQTIRQSFGEGMDIIRLPMLDAELLADNGLGVGQWPDAATGDFDGTLTPLVRALLVADPAARAAFEEFGADFDFMDVDPEDLHHLELISDLVWAYKMLLRDLANADTPNLTRRLLAAVDGTPDPGLDDPQPWRAQRVSLAGKLIEHLPLREIRQSQETWLPDLNEEILPDQQLFPPADQEDENLSLARNSPSLGQGRTSRDDTMCRLRLTDQGHDSGLARLWIEFVVESQGSWDHASDLLEHLQAPGASGDCLSCHSVERASGGQLRVHWESATDRARFTRFDHGPHLTLPELQACTECHVNSGTRNADVYTSFDGSQNDGTFAAIKKAKCATCHNAKTATDQCTTCHNYHVGDEPYFTGAKHPASDEAVEAISSSERGT